MDRGLVGKRFRTDTIIAVPQALEDCLVEAEAGKVPLLVGGIRDHEDLVRKLDRLLHEQGRAVYLPVQRPGNHYHSPVHFFRAMELLLHELPGVEAYIPAGCYGERRAFKPRGALPLMYAVGFRKTGPDRLDENVRAILVKPD